jgi:hypothetical protein
MPFCAWLIKGCKYNYQDAGRTQRPSTCLPLFVRILRFLSPHGSPSNPLGTLVLTTARPFKIMLASKILTGFWIEAKIIAD